jgi:hypothetical protein
VYFVPTVHANDMLLAVALNEKVMFTADMFSPGLPPLPIGAKELIRALEAHDVAVETVAGSHSVAMAVATYAELKAIADSVP